MKLILLYILSFIIFKGYNVVESGTSTTGSSIISPDISELDLIYDESEVIELNNKYQANQKENIENKYNNLEVVNISPLSGSETGSTTVFFSILNYFENEFGFDDDIRCLFGSSSAPLLNTVTAYKIEFSNKSSEYVCISPPHRPESVRMYISINNYIIDTNKDFEYYFHPVIQSISPTQGYMKEEKEIIIKGTNFLDKETLSCHLSEIYAHEWMIGKMDITAIYIDETTIKCIIPKLDEFLVLGYLPPYSNLNDLNFKLSVSINGINKDDDTDFTFTMISKRRANSDIFDVEEDFYQFEYNIPVLSKLSQQYIIENEKINIIVQGKHFMDSYGLSCRLGSNILINAIFLSDTMIKCKDDNIHKPGKYRIQVSNDGWNFYGNEDILLHILPAQSTLKTKETELILESESDELDKNDVAFQLYNVTPSYVYEGEQQILTIYGEDFFFSPSLKCQYGSIGMTQARYLSSNKVQCIMLKTIEPTQFMLHIVSLDPLVSSRNGILFEVIAASKKVSQSTEDELDDSEETSTNESSGEEILISLLDSEKILLTPNDLNSEEMSEENGNIVNKERENELNEVNEFIERKYNEYLEEKNKIDILPSETILSEPISPEQNEIYLAAMKNKENKKISTPPDSTNQKIGVDIESDNTSQILRVERILDENGNEVFESTHEHSFENVVLDNLIDPSVHDEVSEEAMIESENVTKSEYELNDQETVLTTPIELGDPVVEELARVLNEDIVLNNNSDEIEDEIILLDSETILWDQSKTIDGNLIQKNENKMEINENDSKQTVQSEMIKKEEPSSEDIIYNSKEEAELALKEFEENNKKRSVSAEIKGTGVTLLIPDGILDPPEILEKAKDIILNEPITESDRNTENEEKNTEAIDEISDLESLIARITIPESLEEIALPQILKWKEKFQIDSNIEVDYNISYPEPVLEVENETTLSPTPVPTPTDIITLQDNHSCNCSNTCNMSLISIEILSNYSINSSCNCTLVCSFIELNETSILEESNETCVVDFQNSTYLEPIYLETVHPRQLLFDALVMHEIEHDVLYYDDFNSAFLTALSDESESPFYQKHNELMHQRTNYSVSSLINQTIFNYKDAINEGQLSILSAPYTNDIVLTTPPQFGTVPQFDDLYCIINVSISKTDSDDDLPYQILPTIPYSSVSGAPYVRFDISTPLHRNNSNDNIVNIVKSSNQSLSFVLRGGYLNDTRVSCPVSNVLVQLNAYGLDMINGSTFINSTEIDPFLRRLRMSVEITNNDTVRSNSLPLTIGTPPIIDQIAPQYGSTNGDSTIYISTRGKSSASSSYIRNLGEDIYCRFSSPILLKNNETIKIVKGELINEKVIQCQVPEFNFSNVPSFYSEDDIRYRTSTNLNDRPEYYSNYLRSRSEYDIANSHTMLVEISLNEGVDWILYNHSYSLFTYHHPLFIDILSPNIGPSTGGTRAIIHLTDDIGEVNNTLYNVTTKEVFTFPNQSNFLDESQYFCSIHDLMLVNAERIDEGEVRCIMPSLDQLIELSPNLVNNIEDGILSINISLSINQHDFWSVHKGFKYYILPTDIFQNGLSIYPPSGPVSGDTLITISSPSIFIHNKSDSTFNFPSDDLVVDPKCLFFLPSYDEYDDRFISSSSVLNESSQVLVNATSIGQGWIKCRTPSSPSVGNVTVEFTLNGQDFTSSNLSYIYEPDLFISSLSPYWGDISGGTLVQINGGPFLDRDNIENDLQIDHHNLSDLYDDSALYCKFGDQEVEATWVNSRSIECVAPPLPEVKEVQALSFYSLAHKPLIYEVEINSDQILPETHNITMTAFGRDSSIQESRSEIQQIKLSSNIDQDEIQEVIIGVNYSPDPVYRVRINDLRSRPEVQSITTSYEAINEKQYIELRSLKPQSNSDDFWNGYIPEVQAIYLNKTNNFTSLSSSIITLTFGSSSIDVPYSISPSVLRQYIIDNITDINNCRVSRQDISQSERVWFVTFTDDIGNVDSLFQANSVLPNLLKARTVEEVRGSGQEIQNVTMTGIADGGDFFLTFGDDTTNALPWNITKKELKFHLESMASIGIVDVEEFGENNITSWQITFLENAGDLELLTVVSRLNNGVNIVVNEVRKGDSLPLSGTFSLKYGSEVTVDTFSVKMSPKYAEKRIKLALQSLSTIDEVEVEAFGFLNNGLLISVEFLESSEDHKMLKFSDDSLISGTLIKQNIQEIEKGNQIDGNFRLYYDRLNSDGEKMGVYKTREIPFDVTAVQLNRFLEGAIPVFRDHIIAVTRYPVSTNIGSYTWLITFDSSLGDVDMIKANSAGLSGENSKIYVKEVQKGVKNDTSFLTGDFKLHVNIDDIYNHNNFTKTTTPIPYNASENDIKSTLEDLFFLVDFSSNSTKRVNYSPYLQSINVTKEESSFDSDLTFWEIQFYGFNFSSYQLPNVTLDEYTLNGLNILSSVDQLMTYDESNPLNGSFELSFKSESTGLIPYNATNLELKGYLENLDNIDQVNVEKLKIQDDDTDLTYHKWKITFTGSNYKIQGDLPLLEYNSSRLQGTNSFMMINEIQQGNEVKGYFSVVHPKYGHTELLPADSTALDVQNALVSLHSKWNINVTRTSLVNQGYSWNITFVHFENNEFFPSSAGDQSSLRLGNKTLLHSIEGNISAVLTTLQDGTIPVSGDFKLFLGSSNNANTARKAGLSTTLLDYSISGPRLRKAILDLFSQAVGWTSKYDNDLYVHRYGPFSDGGYSFEITLPSGIRFSDFANRSTFGLLNQINGQNGEYSGNVSSKIARELINPIDGNFTFEISFGNSSDSDLQSIHQQITRPIPIDVTLTGLENIIVDDLTGVYNVNISEDMSYDHTNNGARKWSITFPSLYNVKNKPILGIESFENIVASNGYYSINRVEESESLDIWNLEFTSINGSFSFYSKYPSLDLLNSTNTTNELSYEEVSNSIDMDSMTADDIMNALQGLDVINNHNYPGGLNGVYVEEDLEYQTNTQRRFYILLTINEVYYSVNSSEIDLIDLNNGDINYHKNTSSVTFPIKLNINQTDSPVTLQKWYNGSNLMEGVFKLEYGQECVEWTSGVFCWDSVTLDLGYDITSTLLEERLEKLSSFHDIIVIENDFKNILNELIYSPYVFHFNSIDDDIVYINDNEEFSYNSMKMVSSYRQFFIEFDTVFLNASDGSSVEQYDWTWDREHALTKWSGDLIVGGDFPYIQIANATSLKGMDITMNINEETKGRFHKDGDIVYLEVSQNQGNDYTDFKAEFEYITETKIDDILFNQNNIDEVAEIQNAYDPEYDELLDQQIPTLSYINPVSGPYDVGDTEITIYGENFINLTTLSCQFNVTIDSTKPAGVIVAAEFINSKEIRCLSPPLEEIGCDLDYFSLEEHENKHEHPIHGSYQLFPNSHHFPTYLSRLISIEVSNNGEQYSDDGIHFLYQDPIEISTISPSKIYSNTLDPTPILVFGKGFTNSTTLQCRIGYDVSDAIYLTSEYIICLAPSISSNQLNYGYQSHGKNKYIDGFEHSVGALPGPEYVDPTIVFIEVTNNGYEYTTSRITIEYTDPCPTGYYCINGYIDSQIECPPGTYCPSIGNTNFTLCPHGTYQPKSGQSDCIRCPIGFICPEEGLHVPRICPAGYVCEVTGIDQADQLCPEGHFCLEGTATTSTLCGNPRPSNQLYPSLSYAERPSTMRKNRDSQGHELYLGARNSACWSNQTDDFGLQFSEIPARYWKELHLLPLDNDSPLNPIRGRYCLDDTCMRLSDENDLTRSDSYFDYNLVGYNLRRPIPCPPGMYCHPGTAVDQFNMKNYSTPQPCYESMYCPEGSIDPMGTGECPKGFYCPFGEKIPCPLGTYCPKLGSLDPLSCPPGTFNGMVAQFECTNCPRGYICPGFGRKKPAICPPGYVCSDEQLSSPNLRCPSGFYCPNGTETSDPFRNDTTNRPYPCTPGTYCLAGVGYAETKRGDYLYAQPCTEGFYCEIASKSPLGSGLCPKGFTCPEGTSIPVPTAKGYSAELEGTIFASACLPGTYAPTIETETCYPCPPGTTCEEEGMSIADVCEPGTYRSIEEDDGLPCLACPQGTWSKNWGLREYGECTKCAPGVVCSIEGMTQPCSTSDLPTPYEPVLDLNGVAVPEYEYPEFNRPPEFSSFECLSKNDGFADDTMTDASQTFFYGELVPPYIDILGRGAHFRSSDQESLKYQTTAKCYRNLQRFGSTVYQSLVNYHGPSYDIQFGEFHQGYGDSDEDYEGFFGKGSLYIDLPTARKYEAAFNCSPGFQLSNSSLVESSDSSAGTIIYTDADHDPTGEQRSVLKTDDIWYPGTCEADVICDDPTVTEAVACSEGYVCDENTDSITSILHSCHEGYVCIEGTTPDTSIESGLGQYSELCPAGYECPDGTGEGQARLNLCPVNYFCPTGTGDPLIGAMADDSINRGLSGVEANPFLNTIHLQYLGNDDVRLISDHDKRCFAGADGELGDRWELEWLSEDESPINEQLDYLRVARSNELPYFDDVAVTGYNNGSYRPKAINLASIEDSKCARDHKWRLVYEAIERQACDCLTSQYVTVALYRLWKCTASESLDDLSFGSVNPPYTGGHDDWFDRIEHSGFICHFPEVSTSTMVLNLTHGSIPHSSDEVILPSENDGVLDLTRGLLLQYTWLDQVNVSTYSELKDLIETEWLIEYEDLENGDRDQIDPYIYDLHNSIRLIEEYGERLEDLVFFEGTFSAAAGNDTSLPGYSYDDLTPGRLDVCECQELLKCPNGTEVSVGADDIYDCSKTGTEILRRVSVIPSSLFDNRTSQVTNKIKNVTDFSELGGLGTTFPVNTLVLNPLEIVTITLDLSGLDNNLTYNDHYQFSVYVDCKPCPTEYECDYESSPPTCQNPTVEEQTALFESCLDTYTKPSCWTSDGDNILDCEADDDDIYLQFDEPDLAKCLQIPFFCDEIDWDRGEWQVIYDGNTPVADAEIQEASSFEFIANSDGTPHLTTPSCCECEPHSLPAYFSDTTADAGYPDNKHTIIQTSIQAIEEVSLTIVLELFHGLYYGEFIEELKERSLLSIHTPRRAKDLKTDSFLAMMIEEDFDEQEIELPLNLPQQFVRIDGELQGNVEKKFENKILIGRSNDLEVGHPDILNTDSASSWTRVYGSDDSLRNAELYEVSDSYDDVYEDSVWWSNGDDDFDNDYIALPYLPFFSNCDGYGSYISFSKLVEEHPDCDLIELDQTRAVNEYPWDGVLTPFSDFCEKNEKITTTDSEGNEVTTTVKSGIEIQCYFEEEIELPTTLTRWFELDTELTLFQFTKNPVAEKDFVNGGLGWGRSGNIGSLLSGNRLVPVEIVSGGVAQAIPRRVELILEYYQIEKGRKRLVDATIGYEELCTTVAPFEFSGDDATLDAFAERNIEPCEVDVNGDITDLGYILEFKYLPLTWFELLNRFEFAFGVYLVLFIIVGMMSIFEAAGVWLINRVLTKLRHPSPFYSISLFTIILDGPTKGCILGAIPFIITLPLIWLWFGEDSPLASSDPVNSPNSASFEDITGSWLDTQILDEDRIANYRVGRMGTCFVTVGMIVTVVCSRLIVPNWFNERKDDNVDVLEGDEAEDHDFNEDEEEDDDDNTWTPKLWKRAHLIWSSLLIQIFLLWIWEFSYSATFEASVYMFIIVFKGMQMALDIVFEILLKEHMMGAPLTVVVAATEIIVTMGAEDFLDFTLSYFVELSMMVIERLYLDPFVKHIVKMLPRWKMRIQRNFGKKKRKTREDRAKEELEWRKLNEQIELENQGIEPLLDSYTVYSTEATALFLAPLINFFLMNFFEETEMPENYGIRENEMFYYTFFALCIIPFTLVMDVFLLNTQELAHGWRIYDYISYQRYRYSVREVRWMLQSNTLDESIKESMQTIDLMCFSSQYYFVNAFFALGIVLSMFGVTIFLRKDYNPLGDPVLIPIIFILILYSYGLRHVLQILADFKWKRFNIRGLWMTRKIEGTVDDEIAAKLAIGEGRQQDLEQERLELQALNSERFRHRFLERNRPWILQHLVDLLTPSALEGIGPDGRPLIEYIRDVYAELMSIGEGTRRPGDRSDISSDEEDGLEAQRRHWVHIPLSETSKQIALFWLGRARKRRTFRKAIQPILWAAKRDACEVCGKNESMEGVILAPLLVDENQKKHPNIIDNLLGKFEKQYGMNERDLSIWQAFFRGNSNILTKCNHCMSNIETGALKIREREMARRDHWRPTRADDISSDEDDDEDEAFEPMVVTKVSPEGRMLTKWLDAARSKLGGEFPRKEAREQMERYAKRMHELKSKRGKKIKKQQRLLGDETKQEIDVDAGDEFKDVKPILSETSILIAKRWVSLARQSITDRFNQRSIELRENLKETIGKMHEKDDWFYGADLRMEGENIIKQGDEILNNIKTIEAEGNVLIRKIEYDLNTFMTDKREKIDKERNFFDTKLQEEREKREMELEVRLRELRRGREDKKEEFENEERKAREEEGGASTKMLENHREILKEMDEMIHSENARILEDIQKEMDSKKSFFEKNIRLEEQSVIDRQNAAEQSIARIKNDIDKKTKEQELKWQNVASRWVSTAQRKVNVKEQEESQAEAAVQRRRKRRLKKI